MMGSWSDSLHYIHRLCIISLTLTYKICYESSAKMGYTLQRLGGCTLQTHCCFASTLLETLQKFFCLHPCTHTLTIHVIPVSFHSPADEFVDKADLLDPSSSPLIISADTASTNLLPPLPSPPSTDHLLPGLGERNSYVCSPPVPLSVCVSVTKAAVSYC